MKSMTGYGIATGVVEGFGLSCELKTLNGRYLDVNVRLPRELSVFEVPLIRALKGKFSRGSIFLNVTIKNYEYKQRWPFTIDSKKAGLYIELLKTIKKALRLRGRITVDVFTHSPEFFLKDDKPVSDSAVNDMINIVEEAAKKAVLMRDTEGEEIRKELQSLIEGINAAVKNIEGRIPGIIEQYRQKTIERIKDVKQSSDAAISPEVIIGNYIDKIDVHEEIKRIQSHLKAFVQLLDARGTVGKKLEFFTQEFIRELNTIGSKAGEADITTGVIDAKNIVERIKELAQNVE
ncbi:MAG: YicC family protein [Deltaproteobacteria bacterium]|nr:YicC family protein [Deltaproteobacteria bacterium]MCL5878935.1 YicC family protein [Deltaproteobacteria bacterium]